MNAYQKVKARRKRQKMNRHWAKKVFEQGGFGESQPTYLELPPMGSPSTWKKIITGVSFHGSYDFHVVIDQEQEYIMRGRDETQAQVGVRMPCRSEGPAHPVAGIHSENSVPVVPLRESAISVRRAHEIRMVRCNR